MTFPHSDNDHSTSIFKHASAGSARRRGGPGDISTGPAPDGYSQPLRRARDTASNRLRAPVLRRITDR